jgi:selenocysteine-specific elongation factor
LVLSSYFEANPMKSAMPKEEFRRQLNPSLDAKGFQTLLSAFSAEGAVAVSDTAVNLPGHVPTLGAKDQQLLETIEKTYRESAMNPPLLTDLEQTHGSRAKDVTALLLERGTLVKIAPDLFFDSAAIRAAEDALVQYLADHEGITVAQFRDLVGSSRKFVVPMLEYLDSRRLTRRVGDMRVLHARA